MSRILIVEDEKHLAEGVRFNLELEGFQVAVSDNAEAALKMLIDNKEPFDVLLLDVMLPGMDGFTAARQLRAGGCYIPILMLTARGRADDVLEGFDAGADDYLPKPFELKILMARIHGLLRRSRWAEAATQTSDRFEVNGKTIDFEGQQIIAGDKKASLTLMESNLLQFLLRNEGKTVSRKQILESVWGVREDTDTRAIDNFIVRLRRYLEDDPQQPQHLQTVRGVGYKLVQKLRKETPTE